MNGDEKATLSALIDGESDSLEERRFLRDHDPALAIETVQHWQLIGRVLRRDQGVEWCEVLPNSERRCFNFAQRHSEQHRANRGDTTSWSSPPHTFTASISANSFLIIAL